MKSTKYADTMSFGYISKQVKKHKDCTHMRYYCGVNVCPNTAPIRIDINPKLSIWLCEEHMDKVMEGLRK